MTISKDTKHVWAAIIAGGKGTRLFPISYDDCPKQFVPLDEENTFIQATAERFKNLGISPKKIIVIVTNESQAKLAETQLIPRGILSTNICQIDEHFGYAGAMVKAAEIIKKFDSDAVIINTPSDQYIGNDKIFKETITHAIDNLKVEYPIIIGYNTADIVTAMGCGHVVYETDEEGAIPKKIDFIEKPKDPTVADKLIRMDNAAVNTGINLWHVNTLLSVIDSSSIGACGLETDDLMSRFTTLGVVVGDFDWHDCGTLKSLYDINLANASPIHHNVVLGSGKNGIESTGCTNCLLYSINNIELDVVNADGVAVIATTLHDKIYIAIVKLSDSQEVKRLAEQYASNKSILENNLTIKGKNNILLPSNIETDVIVGFVGVSGYIIYPHKDRNGDIRISVIKNNTSAH